MLYWCSVTPWGWQRYIETCRSYDKLCVKNIILTLVHLLVLLYKIHINAQTWITLRKDNILLFQNSVWASSSFSQLLDGAYSYVFQFPGHVYMVHYSHAWKCAVHSTHRGTCTWMWHKSPQPNCVHRVIGFTRNIHLTTLAQHIMYTSHSGWFSRGHPTPQWWHLCLHHKILQTTSALIKWPGWEVNQQQGHAKHKY